MYEHEENVALQMAAAEISHDVCPAPRAARHSSRSRSGRSNQWSREELHHMRELALAGTPLETIAATLRRSTSAIRNKAGMHGISLRSRR